MRGKNEVEIEFEWNDEVDARVKRAAARGTIGIAEGVSRFAKENAHVVSGQLRRSIHVARSDTIGLQRATTLNVKTTDGAVVDVGSWLDYACVEEIGRGHRFMGPAIEQIRPFTVVTMREAFAQEGLI